MVHTSGTPDSTSRFEAVAGHNRLFRRGAVYYFRAKVPDELRAIVGKTELRYSLKTKDFEEAKRQCRVASVKADAELRKATALFNVRRAPEPPAPLSEGEVFHLVANWFIEQEREADSWAAVKAPSYSDEDRETVFENLEGDLREYATAHKTPDGGRWIERLMADFLKSRPELKLQKGSADYERLAALLRRAQVETLHRKIDRLQSGNVRPFDPAFQALYAHSPTPELPRKRMTLKQLTDKFMEHQRANNASTTPVTYSIPVRLLHEVLGTAKQVAEITREDIQRVAEALKRIPAHVTQRYPQMPLLKAAAKADAEKNTARFSPQTVSKYFNNVSAIFNFIEEDGVFTANPVKGKRLREMVRTKARRKRHLFTPTELSAIFHAPLYVGCENDENGYTKPGQNRPRRARFWIPLLALYHGCRLNELCQLYCEDVKERDNAPFFAVRTELDEEEKTEKTLKTGSSSRDVPIHPELVKMGFLDFVKEQRKRGANARLFPELELGKSTQRYSSIFSRWFARFVTHACGNKPKAVFHSFRHHFRTALSEAGVHTDVVEKLCGWAKEQDQSQPMHLNYLHVAWSREVEAVAKVEYKGLDLSHLYVNLQTTTH